MELSSNGNIPAPLAYSPEEVAERRRAMNRAASKKWKAANPDYKKDYYNNNKESFKARKKVHYQNNKEAYKARDKAYKKNKSDETWGKVYKNLGTTCSCPTCTWPSTLALEIDHIIPAKKGLYKDAPRTGVDLRKYIIKNNCWNDFQLLCANCNKLKHRNGGICNCGDPTRKSR